MNAGHPGSNNSWRSHFRQLIDQAVNFILPPICVSCRNVGSLFCDECRYTLKWLQEPLCPRCGRPLSQPSTLCALCQQEPLPLNQIRTAVSYDGPIREAIHKFKYEGMFGVAPALVELMVEHWPEWQFQVDLVVPIPLHPERERERGYNQAQLLVRHLSQQLDLKHDMDALRRIRHTRPQVGLDRMQRRDNVNGAFVAERGRVVDKHILLVDDICTTGATLGAAASALLNCGARTVSGYCIARPVGTLGGQGLAI